MHRRLLVSLFLIAVLLASGAAAAFGQAGDEQQLNTNQRKWESKGLRDYRFTFRWICYCRFRNPVRVSVRAGQIAEIKSLGDSDQSAIPRDQFNDYRTLDQLFDLIRDAIKKKAESIKATYDPENGYLVSGYIDYSRRIADEELGFEVKDFEPLKKASSSPSSSSLPQSPPSPTSTASASSISSTGASNEFTVEALPDTNIWVDALRYGAVPASGELKIKNLKPGIHSIRARLKGRREVTQNFTLVAGSAPSIRINLSVPADKAELSFQNAEALREAGKHTEAIKEYRNALRLRPNGFVAARLGLARSLIVPDEYDAAIAEVRRALREKPGPFPEAHTVLGNIRRSQGFYDEAVTSYSTAIAQSKEASPEAHTGMALVYQDRNQPAEMIKHLTLAAAQANDTEPVIYFLLGSTLERENRMREAVAAYDKYLQLDPNGAQAGAVRSVLKQLRKEAR